MTTRLIVQTTARGYVQRTDAKVLANELTAIDQALRLVERTFHPREALATAAITWTAGSAPLPADFAEADTVSTALGTLDYESPREFTARGVNRATDKCYTIIGSTLQTAAANTTGTLRYFAKPAALTTDGSTNWMTLNYTDALVWLVVAEQHRFVQDWQQADAAMAHAMALMGGAEAFTRRSESSGGRMKMRSNP